MGLYKSRYDDRFVVSRHINGNAFSARHVPPAAEPWDMAGTGCLMVFRPGLRQRFAPFWHVPENGLPVPGHDWSFTWQLRLAGRPVWVEPQVRCKHFVTEQEWV